MPSNLTSKLLWPFNTLPTSYVVIDTETTGLFEGDSSPGLVSIGLVKVDKEKELFSKEFRVRPKTTILPEAETIHGISNAEASKFAELSEVWSEFTQIVADELLVFHNASFDWKVIVSNAESSGLCVPNVSGIFCSQKSATVWSEVLGLSVSSRGPSLDTLTDFLNLKKYRENNGVHGALIDAKQTAMVVQKLRQLFLEVPE